MAFDLNKYTNKAQEAILKAQSLANEYGHPAIEPLHLLTALLGQKDGVAPEVAAKIGARPAALLAELETQLKARPRTYGGNLKANLSRQTVETLTRAEQEAETMTDEYVSTEHILIGLTGDQAMGDFLARHGITRDSILQALT
ncbi:MAG: type VI secretion system ATPase TssH, partial [Anaerolinea sp.]|nr:type VI secretion system ATPase TssH [Anaerolinea sp.]